MIKAEKKASVNEQGQLSRGGWAQTPQGFEVQVRRLTLIVSAMRTIRGYQWGVALIWFQILQDCSSCSEARDCGMRGAAGGLSGGSPHPDLPWSKGEKMGCSLEEEQLRRKEGYLALTVLWAYTRWDHVHGKSLSPGDTGVPCMETWSPFSNASFKMLQRACGRHITPLHLEANLPKSHMNYFHLQNIGSNSFTLVPEEAQLVNAYRVVKREKWKNV